MKSYQKGNFRVDIEKKQGDRGAYFTANLVKTYKGKDGSPAESSLYLSLNDWKDIMSIAHKMMVDGVKEVPFRPSAPKPQPRQSREDGYGPAQVAEALDDESIPF